MKYEHEQWYLEWCIEYILKNITWNGHVGCRSWS